MSVYYPFFLNIEGKRSLVVGGGRVALRKVSMLLEYDAEITIISPEIIKELDELASVEKVRIIQRQYSCPEAIEYDLVISASDNQKVNQQVSEDCRSVNIPVNVVDQPELCTFIVPSIVKRGDVTIAISSGGKAPFLTKYLRKELEPHIPDYLESLSEYAAEFREMTLKRFGSDPKIKQYCFGRFLELNWENLLSEPDNQVIRDKLQEILKEGAKHYE
ncbi:MAG: bifunctional precorrin-2 dehydrogenase/sirohydrochlorin ferrochelatase [candidate division Zixibacteria bacterium]|nr:bifunctional precorrin-2 dehydrogenase/sirohydrochlorin ferrochelatase [candidate division Zixibacteria bacterium]